MGEPIQRDIPNDSREEQSSQFNGGANPSSSLRKTSHASRARGTSQTTVVKSSPVDLIKGSNRNSSFRENSFSDTFREGSPIDSSRESSPIAVGNPNEGLREANSENTIAGEILKSFPTTTETAIEGVIADCFKRTGDRIKRNISKVGRAY
ncbi:uncharacterized protein LOC122513030 [Leptopilina heterotoma]|uniref:uncharacterized protein LOC122513030 n=1 Tax=Leptopilina heterotoma TaxID=63436 RepID=UPI001CA96ECD|nr:uncharacterized protein LOC122513030 [Leptopilina heterotoma]